MPRQGLRSSSRLPRCHLLCPLLHVSIDEMDTHHFGQRLARSYWRRTCPVSHRDQFQCFVWNWFSGCFWGVHSDRRAASVLYNQMRAKGFSIREAVLEGSCRTLRPIIMTALVATFGLPCPRPSLTESVRIRERPLAIVIVGGLIANLVMAFFLLPTLYDWFASPKDVLK